MTKSSAWSSWETKARHGVMACGLGAVSIVIGSWISAGMVSYLGEVVDSSHSPFIANVLAGWMWNAWLWLVFAPIALGVARVFPVKARAFVLEGGIFGFFFWLVLSTALSGFEKFLALPFYALSCLFWFIAGLVWAWGLARWGEHFFRRAQENAEAVSKSNERYYAQWVASSSQMNAGDTNVSAASVSASETETAEAKLEP